MEHLKVIHDRSTHHGYNDPPGYSRADGTQAVGIGAIAPGSTQAHHELELTKAPLPGQGNDTSSPEKLVVSGYTPG
jgi:hypothetical protein